MELATAGKFSLLSTLCFGSATGLWDSSGIAEGCLLHTSPVCFSQIGSRNLNSSCWKKRKKKKLPLFNILWTVWNVKMQFRGCVQPGMNMKKWILHSVKGGFQCLDYDSGLETIFWWKCSKIKSRMNFQKFILIKTFLFLLFFNFFFLHTTKSSFAKN